MFLLFRVYAILFRAYISFLFYDLLAGLDGNYKPYRLQSKKVLKTMKSMHYDNKK